MFFFYQSKIQAFSNEGRLVCANNSFFTCTPSVGNIEALEDVEILCLSFADLEGLYETTSEMDKYVIGSLELLYSIDFGFFG